MCKRNARQCVNLGLAEPLPRCCRRNVTKTLFYVDELFRRHKIKYWLDFGTLLGAVREQRVIHGDHDADISVFSSSRRKIFDLKEEIKRDGYDISGISERDKYGGLCKIHYSPVNRVFVDVWFWYKIPPSSNRLRLVISDHFSCPENRCDFPEYYTKKLVEVPFSYKFKKKLVTRKLMAPADPEEFVRLRYGPDWRTPSGYNGCNWWSVHEYPQMYKW